MSEQTYTIAELAREFDITPRTIRHYEDQGLLSPARAGVQRVYDKRDRTRLKLTLRGKRLGLSLAEIRELIDMYDTAPEMPGTFPAASPSTQNPRCATDEYATSFFISCCTIATRPT